MTATVTLDGRNVTGVTLNGLTITRGRSSIYEDINPGVCVATLLSGDIAPDAWRGQSGYVDLYSDYWQGLTEAARVGVKMEVETGIGNGYVDAYQDTWDGFGTVRFTGIVTAVDYTPGELTITAIDALELLGRVYVTAARPQETDTARALALLATAKVTPQIMGTIEATLTPVDETVDPVTVANSVQKVANNMDAQLYADRDNHVKWRRRDTPAGKKITLPPGFTLTDSLVVTSEMGDVYNVERVTYGPANERKTIEVTDSASVEDYGRREWRRYDTQLVNETDARGLGVYWLANDKDARYRVNNIYALILDADKAWQVVADSIDLYTVIEIPELPDGSPIPSYTAAVLGYTETITQADRSLSLRLAPPNYLMNEVT